jgi:hypothetical protein
VVIFLPLLKFGYIQTFDMAWGPHESISHPTSELFVLTFALKILSSILTSMLAQKVILLSIFSLAGVGAHKLCTKSKLISKHPQIPLLAGLFYMFNPFIYTRLMAGQWLVLCGYAFMPWALMHLYNLMIKPNLGRLLIALSWSLAIGLTSIHAVGFIALAGIVMFFMEGTKGMKTRFKWCFVGLILWLLVDSFWLIPLVLDHSHTAIQISGFGPSEQHAYETTGSISKSVPITALLLEGFWADPQDRYFLPSHLGAYWWFVVAALAILIIVGLIQVFRKRERLGLSLFAIGLIAWWLGMGVGWHISAGTTNWLVAHVPLYRGYREPEKWLMLLALAYSYFLAVGSAKVLSLIKKLEWRQLTFGLIALLPILYTPILLWGAGGQLKSSQYPSDWSTAEQTLTKDKGYYQVLVLPWHEYLYVSFVGRVVANPTNHYFKQNMIISDNPELRGDPPSESTPIYKLLDNQIIPSRGLQTNDASLLKPYHVKYVLLLKEADWKSYGWVSQQTGWQRIQNSATLELYKLKAG